jgi:hypothetical protein
MSRDQATVRDRYHRKTEEVEIEVATFGDDDLWRGKRVRIIES